MPLCLCCVVFVPLQAYGTAHRLEIEAMPSVSGDRTKPPSPYARLNQLTLEILASDGSDADLSRLLVMVKQAEEVGV